jgi:hypothetical protein
MYIYVYIYIYIYIYVYIDVYLLLAFLHASFIISMFVFFYLYLFGCFVCLCHSFVSNPELLVIRKEYSFGRFLVGRSSFFSFIAFIFLLLNPSNHLNLYVVVILQ